MSINNSKDGRRTQKNEKRDKQKGNKITKLKPNILTIILNVYDIKTILKKPRF